MQEQGLKFRLCQRLEQFWVQADPLTCAESTIMPFSQSPTWTAREGCILRGQIHQRRLTEK